VYSCMTDCTYSFACSYIQYWQWLVNKPNLINYLGSLIVMCKTEYWTNPSTDMNLMGKFHVKITTGFQSETHIQNAGIYSIAECEPSRPPTSSRERAVHYPLIRVEFTLHTVVCSTYLWDISAPSCPCMLHRNLSPYLQQTRAPTA
jgi:hypothetical protein